MSVQYFNWWCDASETVEKRGDNSGANTQDYWFTRFFSRACQDWEHLQPSDITVCSVFGPPQQFVTNQRRGVRIFFVGENLMQQHQHYKINVDPYVDMILGFTNFFDSKKFTYFPLWLLYWDSWSQVLFSSSSSLDLGFKGERKDKAVIIANRSAN